MKAHLTLVALVALVALVVPVQAQMPEGDGCVTAKCHADMGTQAFVHGPMGAGLCTVCHTRVEGEDHEFRFFADKGELCFACHENSRDIMLNDHLHSPVADGDCIGCHDPHQSQHRYTLKGEGADLCFQCHKKDEFSREFVHGPVAVGDCNACHNPHASAFPNQLLEDPAQMCLQCHTEKVETMSKRHIHPPVSDKCTSCHNPHSHDAKYMLGANPPELCAGCHGDLANHTVSHEPVAQGNCSKCHDVHASDNPRMFPVAQEDLCLSCHQELRETIAAGEHKHGPVQQGDCSACHSPHGSENYRILTQYFPDEFYMPYKTENYAMCFECHNKDIALNAETRTLTDFRDGSTNLHFLHVNKDVKGRSCKACHAAHATDQSKHIRTEVPFGSMNWDLPVTYTRYEDGGKCVVGCHAPKEYHRE